MLKGYGKDTVEDLQIAYDYYNKELFDDELPNITIEWNNRFTRVTGRLTYNSLDESFKMEIGLKFASINDETSLTTTLVHEMIHVWQKIEFGEMNHGDTFKNKASEINEITNLKISRLRTDGNSVPSNRKTHVYQCIDCKEKYIRKQRLNTDDYYCSCRNINIKHMGRLVKIK